MKKGSTTGCVAINNGTINKFVKPELVQQYLDQGYALGLRKLTPEIKLQKAMKTKETIKTNYGSLENFYMERQKRTEQTNLERYGEKLFCLTEEGRKKFSESQKNGGVAKRKKTCLSRYNDENYCNREKRQATLSEKYGEDIEVFQSESFKQQRHNTLKEKYGDEEYVRTQDFKEKSAKTCLERYGNEVYAKTDDFKEKWYAAYYSGSLMQKKHKTYLERYGNEIFEQSEYYKQQVLPNKLKKEYETKKQNNSFNSSKPEELLKQYYIDKFGRQDILVNQIVDERQPFNVDIYIKSLDKFIELQGSWTHGPSDYDKENIEHQKLLEEWKNKAVQSEYYQNAIKIWTIKDVEKLEIATQNNINLERIRYVETKHYYEYSNGIKIIKEE